MATSGGPERIVIGWARLYTRGLDAEIAQRRTAELASDCFEQREWGRVVGASSTSVATSMVSRTLAGIPADLLWRRTQIATAQGRSPVQIGRPMGQWMKKNWWVALAILVGVLFVGTGLYAPFEADDWRSEGGWIVGLVLMTSFGGLLLGGAWMRRRRRVAGDVMIAIGSVPLFPLFWTIVLPALGLLILIPAVLDAADARSLGDAAHPDSPADLKRHADPVLGALSVALVLAGGVSLLSGTQEVAFLLLTPITAAILAYIIARRIDEPITRLGATLVGMGLVNFGLLGPAILLFGDDLDLGGTALTAVVQTAQSVGFVVGVIALIVGFRKSRGQARPA